MSRCERSRSPHRVEEQREHQYEDRPVSLRFYRPRGSDCSGEMFFEIQVVAEASGEEICLLEALPWWTMRDLKAALAKNAETIREQLNLMHFMNHLFYLSGDLCFQGDVIDNDQKLIDLDDTREKLILSLRCHAEEPCQRQPLVSLKFFRTHGSDQLFFKVQVLGAASGDVICCLKGLPWWTIHDLKIEIVPHAATSARRQRLLFQNQVLHDTQRLIDLDSSGETLIVNLVRMPGPDTEEVRRLRNWLISLADGASIMLEYEEVLTHEMDANLEYIAAAFKINNGERRGILGSVDPSFWDIAKVQRTRDKMLFARGIARLP